MNIEITANSLSRSNQFNLFVIFLDALIVIIYDTKRSKYVMLTKKQKRRNNSEKLKFLKRIKQGYQPSEENESKYIQTTSHKENIKIL